MYENCFIKETKIDYILISRRSIHYAGTRFWTRGLDDEGHAANSVETEQIIISNYSITSFVQVRGSIPLQWSQKPTLDTVPPIKIHSEVKILKL